MKVRIELLVRITLAIKSRVKPYVGGVRKIIHYMCGQRSAHGLFLYEHGRDFIEHPLLIGLLRLPLSKPLEN